MDYNKVMRIVIDKAGSDAEDKGEINFDDNNLRKRVNYFLDAIKDPDSPFHLLEDVVITEEELARIVYQYMNNPNINSRFIHSVETGNYDYKESPLYDKDLKDMRKNTIPLYKILGRSLSDIPPQKEFIYEILSDYYYKANSQNLSFSDSFTKLKNIKDLLHYVFMGVVREKEELDKHQQGFYCDMFSSQFLDLCMYAILTSIFFLVIHNPYITFKTGMLEHIANKLDDAGRKLDIKLQDKSTDEAYRYITSGKATNSDFLYIITTNFHYYLSKDSYFYKLNDMDNILIEELKSSKYKSFDKSMINDLKEHSTPDEISKIIRKHSKKKYQFDERISNIESLFKKSETYNKHYLKFNPPLQMAIAFQEIYMSNSKYNNHTASTIVYNLLDDNVESNLYDSYFIGRKLIRGFFTIHDMSCEYQTFIRITKKCRKLFLKPYKCLFYFRQCELAYNVTIDILEKIYGLLLEDEYLGLVFYYVTEDDD